MSLGQRLAPHLPYLRRYARALTGNQHSGDAYVRATLEALVDQSASFPDHLEARVGLYQLFHGIWHSAQVGAHGDGDMDDGQTGVGATEPTAESIASRRLARVTPVARQLLLLTAMEGFSVEDASIIVDVDAADADRMIDAAFAELDDQTNARVLIIEDEPIIAMDIESIVTDMGHRVVGIAVTRDAALEEARAHQPSLVLADIQLADDSSGIDAVGDILSEMDVPVIFVTAFPERLLTGERAEPTFLITKPFKARTLKATIAQALFFNPATVPA
jgi:CheY-like chemotaxis protein/DNA-directed RNA polymerase specialized sigma24 family protein